MKTSIFRKIANDYGMTDAEAYIARQEEKQRTIARDCERMKEKHRQLRRQHQREENFAKFEKIVDSRQRRR